MAACGVTFFACQKEEPVNGGIVNVPMQKTNNHANPSGVVRSNLNLIEKAFLDLGQNQELMLRVKNKMDEATVYEKETVTLSDFDLSFVCNDGETIEEKMCASLINNGGHRADLEKLHSIINGFELNGKVYRPSIYVPYHDLEVSYDTPVIGRTIIGAEALTAWELNNGGQYRRKLIDEQYAANYAVILLAAIEDGEELVTVAGGQLPYRKCFCSRSRLINIDGEIVTSPHGTCDRLSRDAVHCGMCGRTGILGRRRDCGGAQCRGC